MLTRTLTLLVLLERLCAFALGVDYGSEFHKASMIIPGKFFYMVENAISKKKTPTTLAFCGGDRLFENSALKKYLKKNCDTFSFPNRFLNKRLAEDTYNSELFLDSHNMVKDDIGYLFAVKKSNLPQLVNFPRNSTDGEHYLIRAEEVNAMILQNNLLNAGKTGNTVFKEAVVTIPSNDLSIEARKRIKAANELAGMKVLGVVHENTAAALYYAIDRAPVPENILFVNVGASSARISLISYRNDTVANKGNVTETLPSVVVIDDIYSEKVSGHIIDDCMSRYALEKYLGNKPNKAALLEQVDLYKRRRMISDIKRPKEILSVNKEANLTMEDFFGSMPLTTQVVRTEFEAHCKHITADLKQILRDFDAKLAKHKLSKKDIHAIEIIGGSTRVPFIQETLKEYYGLKLNTRINGDDGPALGATFLAGNYTIGVRTKKILLTDGPSYPVRISVRFANATEAYKEAELFGARTRYGAKKTLSVQSLDQDTHIRLYTTGDDSYFKEYLVKNTQAILENYKDKNVTEWKAVFSFEMDTLGIPALRHAELLLKQNVTEVVNITIAKNNTASKNKTGETEKEIKQETRNYNKTSKERLSINIAEQSYKSLLDNKAEFDISRKLLSDLKEHEEHKRNLSMLRNTLEGYIYKLKTIADTDEHAAYLNEEERAGYRSKSAEIDDFFMSEHLATANMTDLKNRTRSIESFMYSFEHRKSEHKARNSVYTKALEAFTKTTESLENIANLRKWIPADKVEEVREKISAAKDEVMRLYQEQIATPLHVNPTFTKNWVADKVETAQRFLGRLRLIEKPKKAGNKTAGIEELLAKMGSFNATDPNLSPDKLKELLDKMKEFNITAEDIAQSGEELAGEKVETDVPEATEGENSEADAQESVKEEEKSTLR